MTNYRIEQNITSLINFLKPQTELINCHMVEFFTENLWNKFIPIKIQDELTNNPLESTYKILKTKNVASNLNYRNLTRFLIDIDNLQKTDLVINLEEFLKKNLGNEQNLSELKFKYFMSAKKIHEVHIMAEVCAVLCKRTAVNHLIDIGDGKGYLSSFLTLNYQINVLGIDSSPTNTSSSKKRLKKMQKYWQGLTSLKIDPNKSSYRQITSYVTQNTNLTNLLEDNFSQNIHSFGLIGLHTCGNLANSILQLYASNSNVKFLCSVGCCYHLIQENSGSNTNSELGFPMSNLLKSEQFYLGRNARMLASQSLDRISCQTNNNRSLFYRAVFQVFLKRKFKSVPSGQVGRKCSDCQNFFDYVQCALKEYKIENLELNRLEIESLLDEYLIFEKNLNMFYLIRMRYAYAIELLILLDRLLYLVELGFTQSFLVKMFEPEKSPRHLGIISFKNIP